MTEQYIAILLYQKIVESAQNPPQKFYILAARFFDKTPESSCFADRIIGLLSFSKSLIQHAFNMHST